MESEEIDINHLKDRWAERILRVYYAAVCNGGITRNWDHLLFSSLICEEILTKFLEDKEIIQEYHKGMEGTDPFKLAGYLTYWIAKLKPIQIVVAEPTKNELLINEKIAIYVAVNYICETRGINMLGEKFVNDLIYLLRHRTNTVRFIPMLYCAYCEGFDHARTKFPKRKAAATGTN